MNRCFPVQYSPCFPTYTWGRGLTALEFDGYARFVPVLRSIVLYQIITLPFFGFGLYSFFLGIHHWFPMKTVCLFVAALSCGLLEIDVWFFEIIFHSVTTLSYRFIFPM